MALCCLLVFWTGGDAHRVDRLFRASGLIREKWDEVHYANGRTYGEVAVQRALDRVDDRYEPDGEPTTGSTADEVAWQAAAHDASSTERRTRQLLATIERLDARIDDLEAENDRLRERLGRVDEERTTTNQLDVSGRSVVARVRDAFRRS